MSIRVPVASIASLFGAACLFLCGCGDEPKVSANPPAPALKGGVDPGPPTAGAAKAPARPGRPRR
jgi:hypothetical protein